MMKIKPWKKIFFGGVFIVFVIGMKSLLAFNNGFSRNNDNFIDASFWNANPSSGEIITALFGDGLGGNDKTAYTQGRTGNCTIGNMNVQYIQNYDTSGVNSMLLNPLANTIYVLEAGRYIISNGTTGIIFSGNCSAIIAKGETTLYTDQRLPNTAILKTYSKSNIIIANVKVDGIKNGDGTIRFEGNIASGNSDGIFLYDSKNVTLHHVQTYNNRNGINISNSRNINVIDSISYNTYSDGIYLYGSSNGNIINSLAFNNKGAGISLSKTYYTTIQNCQAFSNNFYGIAIDTGGNNIILNTQTYNNLFAGVFIKGSTANNIMYNLRSYNNNTNGISSSVGATGNKYYGNLRLFGNTNNAAANNNASGTGISMGYPTDITISGFNRTTGNLNTGGTMGYNYITNAVTEIGSLIITGTSRTTAGRGRKDYTGQDFIEFNYGTGIILQTGTVIYSGSSLLLGNFSYTNNKYIAQIDAVDEDPDSFSFSPIIGAEINQLYTSNIITLSGMYSGINTIISLSGRGTIYKNGTDIGTSGTGKNGDQFYIAMTGSSNYYTIRNSTLYGGANWANFSVTTKQDPTSSNTPSQFIFVPITGAELNQLYTSNIITLTGMSNGAVASGTASGQGILYKNGINIGTNYTGTNGDQFYIGITGSSTYLSTKIVTLQIGPELGATSGSFSVTTKQDTTPPTFTGISSGTTYGNQTAIYFSDDNLSGATLNGKTYTSGTIISNEGNYIFIVTDTAGNSTGASFKINYPKQIIITFDQNIATGVITKAPIKYNKDLAYGWVIDDGGIAGYQPVFQYFNGGIISGEDVNFIAPGLYYTDGAGNDIAFRGGYARYSVNRSFTDLHYTTPAYMTWTQLKETYLNGWDVVNHGRTSSAYPASGELFNYPDNPPGTTGLDYRYELEKANTRFQERIGISGAILTHVILPSGDTGYTQPARDLGYKSVSSQGTSAYPEGINIYNTIDLNHLLFHREYYFDDGFTTGTMITDIDTLMNAANTTTKVSRQSFSHGVKFTGSLNGSISRTKWKYLMDHISNTYGKNGSDSIWIAGPQEVYEYIASKQETEIATTISGNQLIINLDTSNLEDNLRRKSLTLLVGGTNANITNIQYQTGIFSFHSENTNSGLINIEWGDYYPTDRNPSVFNVDDITGATRNQLYTSNIIDITGMSAGLNTIIYLSGDDSILYKNNINIGTGGTGSNGDQFYIAMTGSANYSEIRTTQLFMGTQSSTFTITTTEDVDPDQFVFTSIYDATRNQLYTSNSITLTGMSNGVSNTINVSGRGTLYKNGINIGTNGTGANGDQFYIAMNASANYFTIRIGTVSIGERTATFSISTIQDDISTGNTRDNDNFINKSFWNTNPTSGQIINALFGDGNGNGTGGIDTTAYTKHWTGNCNIWSMNVSNISNFDTSGIDSLPLGLTANTIYVLDPGRYIMSNTIDFSGNCIAIIGKGDVYLYSAGDTAIGIMLQATNRKNVIIDNLKIDGLNNGSGQLRSATPGGASTGSGNSKGISLYNVTNGTLYRIHAFNNKVNTSIVGTNNIETIDSLFYSSSLQGYSIYGTNPGSKNYLINSQVFNNNSIGISIDTSYNNVISNTLVYNNGFHGIDIDGGGNNLINNIQSYNNLRYGIKMEGNTTNNIINDTRLYNNSIQGIWLTAGSSGTYYGTLKMFSNKNGGTSNLITGGGVMVVGNATDTNISGSNRSAGTLDVNGAIDYSYIVNPINRSGQYFISGNNRSTSNRDNRIVSGDMFIDFTYGTGLLHQANNVGYTGGGLGILSIPSYNANNYIGQIDNILNKDPDPFTFLSTTGADINQLYTSNIIIITGIANETFSQVSLSGRGTIYKNGDNIGTSGTGSNGDQFYIGITGSSNYYTIRYGALNIGETSAIFSVTTRRNPLYNDIPVAFSFVDITGTVPNQLYTSNIVIISGMSSDGENTVTANGNAHSIYKNGIYKGTSTTGANGDQFYMAMNASTYYLSTVTGGLSVGTSSSIWSITTMKQPVTDPNPFIFDHITGANINQVYTSNIITFSGIDEGLSSQMVLSGIGTLYKNNINIGTGGTGANGDQFYITITSPSIYSTTGQTILIAGNTSAEFSISTKQDTTPPTFIGVISGVNSSGTVIITYQDDNISGATINGNTYISGTPITGEGDYTFLAFDTAGNSTGATFSIIYPKTIIITFQNPIDTGGVSKAPIKYNKDLARSFTEDDAGKDTYTVLYKYFNGGRITGWNTDLIAPGAYSTDGAGNDIPFRGGTARFSVGAFVNLADLHNNPSSSYMLWSELKELYLNGRDIINHGWTSASLPENSGLIFNYPDNPPGTTGLDYTYELWKNKQRIQSHIGITGTVAILTENNPTGDDGYIEPARSLGYRAINGGERSSRHNLYPSLDLYRLNIPRAYYIEQNFTTGNITADIDALMLSGESSAIKPRRSYFNHGQIISGDTNGSLSFTTFRYLIDHINNVYGRNGSDRIRVAGQQEVYEYIASKQLTNLSTVTSGNQLIVTLDVSNVYSDLRRKSLSLIVSGTENPIQSIQYESGAFSFHSENTNSGLINIERGEYVPGDRNPNEFQLNTLIGAQRNQIYTSNIITLTGMSPGLDNIIYATGNNAIIYKNGTNKGTNTTGNNGDQFYIAMTGSNNYNDTKTAQLLIGQQSSTFTITTLDNNNPDPFSFTSITGATRNQLYTSNTVTLAGMTSGASNTIALAGWGMLYKNGVNIGTGGTGTNGDQFYIAITGSANYYSIRNGTLSMGEVSADFSVTTIPDTTAPLFSGISSGSKYSGSVSILFSDDDGISGATLNGSTYISGSVITGEGVYTFIVTDIAGNATGATFRINYPKQIIITFDQDIATGILTKAPVKYNKNIAYSFTFDDGYLPGYSMAFKYLAGGEISGENNHFIAPGVYYTDGAGNDISFSCASAWISLNSEFGDHHSTGIINQTYINRNQVREMYLGGWDILNHTLRHKTSVATGEIFTYPDDPPGTTGMDYTYEIRKNDEYTRDHMGVSGFQMTHFVTPSGDRDYIPFARDLGYKSMAHQSYTTGKYGLDMANPIDIYHLMMYRKYFTSEIPNTGDIKNDVDMLLNNSSGSARFWRQSSTHSMIFSGVTIGGMIFDLWRYGIDYMNNDKIRFAGPQDVYEYIASKQETELETTVSGNQLIVNLDTSGLEPNLRRKSLTLLLSGTNANITDIAYQTGIFSFHSENKGSGLINVERGNYYPTDRNPHPFTLNTISGANINQLYTSNTVTLTGMSPGLNNIIYLSGGTASLYKNGNKIGTGGTGANGDQFYITITGGSTYTETKSTQLLIGLQSSSFSLTTLDNINPAPFAFIGITGATRNQVYTSNIITLTGMSPGISNTIILSGNANLYKNGVNIGSSGTGTNGDQFSISLISSSGYYETYTGTVTIGTTSASWSITTLANLNPNTFNFTAITGATRNQVYTSNIITLAGMTNGQSNVITLAGSGTLYKNGVNIGSSGTGANGDQFYITITGSSNYYETYTGTVNIGTTSASWSIITTQDNIAPTGGFSINSGAIYTNTGTIWLTNITGNDDSYPIQVRFSNNKITRSQRTETLNNSNWVLSGNDGLQYVYAQFKDGLGNTTTGDITSTIILDTTAPTYSGVVDNQTYITTVQVRFSDTNISGTTLNGIPYTSGTPITQDNTYIVRIYDRANNMTQVSFQIVNNNPSPFSFTAITGANTNQLYTSNIITLTGMSPGIANSVLLSGNGIIYKNGTNIGTAGTGANGDQFYIAMTGSNNYTETKSSRLSVGNQYADFSISTKSDISGPISGNFIINNEAIYTTNTLVSIDAITGHDDTPPLQVRFSNNKTVRGTWTNMTSTKSRTLTTGDGIKTVYMQIKDNLGNISQEDISDTIILDTTVPTYSGASDQTLYSGNVSVQFTDVNISGATINGVSYISGTPITEEGDYTIIIWDLAGNNTRLTFGIDRQVSASITYNPTGPARTSGNVIGTLTGIGEEIFATNGSLSHTFTNNGIYVYTFRDSLGNVNSLTGQVDWIDNLGPQSPNLVFPANTGKYGAEHLTLQWDAPNDTTGGIGTLGGYLYTVKKNGSIYTTGTTQGTSIEINNLQDGTYAWQIVAYDGLGNQGTPSTEKTFMIDTTLPSATIVYQPSSGQWTSGNVLATITGFNKTVINLNTGRYLFNENGSFTFTFQDEVGNTGSSLANVRWIDKLPPEVPSLNLTSGSKINTSKILEIQTPLYSGAGISGYEYEVASSYNMNTVIDRGTLTTTTFSLATTNEGKYFIRIRVKDSAGNSSERSNPILFFIDTTKPTATITYSPASGPTTEEVIANLSSTSEEITGLNQTGYTFIQNGSFTFTFQDEAGNTGEVLASVDWIQTYQVILIQTGNAIDAFIKNGYNENTGNGSQLFSAQELQTGTTVIGSLPIVFDQYTTIPTQVILQSTGASPITGQIVEIKIPQNTVLMSGGISCEETLFAPSFSGNDIAQAILTDKNIYSTIKAGRSCLNSSILFKTPQQTDQSITIKIKDESIPNGTVKIWYSTNANDWTYLSTAVANNGIVSFSSTHLTYFTIGTDKATSPTQGAGGGGGGGGGGGATSIPTNNPTITDVINTIFNGSATGIQETPQTRLCSIKGSPYSTEINNAYQWSCKLGITSMSTIQGANTEGEIIRSHLAKMISNYIIATKGPQIQSDKACNFSDMKKESEEMKYYAIMACKLGIMGIGSNGKAMTLFSPNQEVTRAQFGTILSRVLRGETYTSPILRPYYENHLQALKLYGIMNKILNPEYIKETRGNIMLMLMRSQTIK